MFKTKQEVDKHVENCLKKIINEKERNNKSYIFAKLYYDVGDYEQARRYVASYLSVKPKSPQGHYLLGLALEKLGKTDASLDAFKTSLQLDPKQNRLVLKVCELLACDDMDLDIAEAKYFHQLAENVDPHNPSIYNLKEKLIMREQKNPDDVVKFLLSELEIRPTDVNLRIRLLRNFVQNNKISQAYKHVQEIEQKNLWIFSKNLSWYEVVADVLIRYKRQSQQNLTWPYWCLLISVLDKILMLQLDEKNVNVKDGSEYINQLFIFDQSLHEASQNIKDCPDRQLSTEFLKHYSGQLYLYFAEVIFKQAKKDLIPFKEAAAITLPLLFSAYDSKPIDLQASWINHLQESQKNFVNRWHREASFRCSQAGHTLSAAAKDRKSIIIAKATQHSSGMWQEQLFKKVFVVRDQQLKMSSSHFVANQVDLSLKLPNKDELLEFDEESFYVFPDSIEHYIWVSMNNELAKLNYLPFQGLHYSVKNLKNCGAETLNLLDVQAFIYCASICAKTHLQNLKHMLYYDMDRPNVLPEAVTGQLSSIEQAKFLKAAYKMYKNEHGSDSGEMRLTLIRGIEAVRCFSRHGLDVALLVELADIFAEKANKSTKQSEIEFSDARAEMYWGAALPILEQMKNNQAVTYSTNRIFEYKSKEMPLFEICRLLDKGKLYLGTLAMKRKEYQEALSKFEQLKDPYASYYQAQIYLQMSNNNEGDTSEMKNQNVILLSKTRDALYLTLDRLREPSIDRNHPLNGLLGSEIEKIERLLSRVNPDCSNRNECDGMSDENENGSTPDDSTEHYTSANFTAQFSNAYLSPLVSRNDTRNKQSTPMRLNLSRKEARPSPERLDAQLRQLMATKDATVHHILDEIKFMSESHTTRLVEELRNLQLDNLKTMKSSMVELKDLKRSMDELKNSVDELQSFRNVTDLVYELKREIADMKKDNAKYQHVNDDLYVLGEDYPEYNLASNVNLNPSLYQNYPNRMAPTVPPPAALYPHGFYPSLYGSMPPYGYPNLGLSQPALPYGAEQQLPPDLRGLPNPIQANPIFAAQNLAQPPTIQPPLNLATSNVNPSLLTGQGLSQINSQASQPKQPVSVPAAQTSLSTASVPPVISTKSAPANVVITSSDPLPTQQSSVSQPVLSVTIPPQHIKGNVQKSQPHNYQIPLPATSVTSTPSILSKPAPAISTEGMLSNVAPPVYSAISDKQISSRNLGLQIEKTIEGTFSSSPTTSSKSAEVPPEHVLPNEVILFECPAKLYRMLNDSKEFKEKGSGVFKLIENKNKNTVRILMRQDLGNIIANHYVTKDLKIASMKDNSYFWSALDYSEGPSIKKFCLKFKNADDAKKFYDAFEKSKQILSGTSLKSQSELTKPNDSKDSSNTFGGFMFSNSPIFKTKPAESTPVAKPLVQEENKVQSPFANFSFGINSKNNAFVTDSSKTNLSLLSSIASTPPANDVKSPDTSKHGDSSLTEDFVPTAEFQPVIPLPDMVEVKTGEEESEVLFNCRSKLLRFDAEKKEWKERGLGHMKILREKSLVRLLMRREQIHKVCCNHQLLKSMNFQYMPNNLKALTWCAQDFADEVLKSETFAIRFKTEEQANDFLKCILNAQASLNDDNSYGEPEEPKKVLPESSQGFGDKFKPSIGSWECKICYIMNDNKANTCAACETPRLSESQALPSIPKEAPSQKPPSSGWGDAFKPKAGTWECPCCLVRNEGHILSCLSCESPKDGTVPKKESSSTLKGISLETPFKFSFGIGAGATNVTPTVKQETAMTKTETPGVKQDTASAFKFGSLSTTSSGFGFGSTTFTFSSPLVTEPDPPCASKDNSDSFVFGSPAAHNFEFKPRSPRKSSGPGDEESDGSYLEEEADNIYFKPVIPLPNKVEVKTGEEEEQVLYCHRSKLFRFVGSEWKERGIGDLKILKNKVNGKLRVLMRRDQVLKICLNHALTTAVEYLPKDEKTWLFLAADFSEGEVSHDQFCVRFKTAEIAKEFKEAVTKALDQSSNIVSAKDEQHESDDSDEVEFISETIVTPEESKEAERLSLPPKFLSYKQLPLCTCMQCVKDDEYFRGTVLDEGAASMKSTHTLKSDSANNSVSSDSPAYLSSTSFSFGATPKQETSSKSIFGSAQTGTSLFGNTNLFGPTKSNLFGTPIPTTNLFGTNISSTTTSSSIFGANTSTTPSTKSVSNLFTPPTTNLFGTNASSTTTTSSSIFGSTAPTTPTIFGSFTPATKPPATASPFGSINMGSLFGNSNASLFGTGANLEFGKGGNIFGQPVKDVSVAKPLFGGDTTENSQLKTANLKEDDEVVLKCTSDISFSSLAQKNQNLAPVFEKPTDGSTIQPFAFIGAGAPVFGSKKKQDADPNADKSQDGAEGNEDEEGEEGDGEYDPHYEPIIPMPDAIVVSTGEEDETIIFNERAKLFRYDADLKEWKERGVGQMKILHHPNNGSYRFLLRREQVHKIVLNQLITPTLEVQPMKTSDKAWMWAGYNYVEDQTNLEKLAIRFKYLETAQKFFDEVQGCITAIRETQSQEDILPATIQNYGLENVSSDSNDQDDNYDQYHENYYDEDDPYDEDYEGERTVMISKMAMLQELSSTEQWVEVCYGEIQIYYDSAMDGSKILFTDDGAVISNSVIGVNTIMKLEANQCSWRTVELANEETYWRDLRAVFDSDASAHQFHNAYLESIAYAQEWEVIDDLPGAEVEESE